MVRVKPESEIRTNYEQSTAIVPARYEAGVRAGDWKDPALEGQDLYEAQMRRDEILRRRSSGIEKVSDEEWRSKTIKKGKPIIAARMKEAAGDMVSGYRPYRETLLAVDLPPKVVDPMQNLINRAGAVVMALVEKKKELEG